MGKRQCRGPHRLAEGLLPMAGLDRERRLARKAPLHDALRRPSQSHRPDRPPPGDGNSRKGDLFRGLFSDKTSPWLKLIKMYLIYQNGEACIACPITCTEGLVKLLEKFADTPETKQILQHCKEGIDGDFAIGAQYLSEIQGGSDVPANVLEAVPEGDGWRLYGTKFFCSATHAEYAVVTAKPQGS